VRDAEKRATEIQAYLGEMLLSAGDAAQAEREFGRDPRVFATSNDGRGAAWDIVVVGTGSSGAGISELTLGARACLRFSGRVGDRDLAVEDIPCPARLANSTDTPSYDETVELFG
jgi:hypothetical protein